MVKHIITGRLFLTLLMAGSSLPLFAQQAWFIDGYHGGIWGHYPKGYTSFVIDQLRLNPQWKINLEIEPVTWDAVKADDSVAYAALRKYMAAPARESRVEYVNPGYGQSYLYTGSGESLIRQFSYGIKKLREHFPGITFTTYSTEEPCFTSALPQVLTAFGFKYASLKNPNTCWGGYTRAFGGELVNWIGPDGSSLRTVPRYATEALEPKSTWQTTAWINSPAYIKAALDQGIQHPVGMTLQDAGWRNGPWLSSKNDTARSQYTTWRNYFERIANPILATDWRLTQEDIQVSLVWGAQVLQRIARQVRRAEDKLVMAEKLAAMAVISGSRNKAAGGATFVWPQEAFDEAWQNLLLAQHHDCWIVPYNGRRGDTWADKVRNWTAATERICDSIVAAAKQQLAAPSGITVYNTTAVDRNELVSFSLPAGSPFPPSGLSLQSGRQSLPVQLVTNDSTGHKELLFKAAVPAAGYSSFNFSHHSLSTKGAAITRRNELYVLETDLYRLTINPALGGAIISLISKQLQNKEWIKAGASQSFNGMRGNFPETGGIQSTDRQPAIITILENGPLRIKAKISGTLAGHPYYQLITLVQGEPRIDCSLHIDWQKHTTIGNDYKQTDGYKAEDYRKAFYDDRDKLLLSFPVALAGEKIYKNAPFDVTASRLENTFFTTWDSIRNNIVLHWVDVVDRQEQLGMALFTDHTTAYAHGKGQPLSLVVQYAGKGLWGRNYVLDGPTVINYSLLPHAGAWDAARLESERARRSEPLQVSIAQGATAGANTKAMATQLNTMQTVNRKVATQVNATQSGNKKVALLQANASSKSLVRLDKAGWEISTMTIDGNDWLIRLYNAASSDSAVTVYLQAPAVSASLENLDGTALSSLAIRKNENGMVSFLVTAPRFGIRTIRIYNSVN
ncbi:glycosyl hydrolase [Paraflavitalea sp. CAU 1676]|uniref:glycoside hydrolase family 38 N-terminal domain-containing protein n=1 Tax=Paraflavitalea sp. CAU 1676 TaxID=3032598 RepID=UPI0023DAB8FD|nr:glycosyl hydrolase [Paraflavitalea sp. CAU 1676]MDF2192323.1 glycosyl hydrolase [Paraflavitalea sp. CAU 1676]